MTKNVRNINTLRAQSGLDEAQAAAARQLATSNNKLLLILWLVAESILFVSLIYANFAVRFAQGQWPPQGVDRLSMGLPLAMTAVLLISSLTTILGVSALKRGDRAGFGRFTIGTLVLGAVFVVGIASLLARIQYNAYTGVYNAMFFALWIVHIGHAVAVLGFLGYVGWRGTRGKYGTDAATLSIWPVEAAAYLWHFLDIMWIILFVVLYLV